MTAPGLISTGTIFDAIRHSCRSKSGILSDLLYETGHVYYWSRHCFRIRQVILSINLNKGIFSHMSRICYGAGVFAVAIVASLLATWLETISSLLFNQSVVGTLLRYAVSN